MAKSPKPPLSFTSYALNKCLIGYGVVNGIINAAIFAGLHAAAEGATFDMAAVVSDLSFTGLLLGMLLFEDRLNGAIGLPLRAGTVSILFTVVSPAPSTVPGIL